LAAQLGIRNSTVATAWKRWGPQPWRRETFKFPTDPELEAKICDVVGLYLDPPEKAVVLSVDESGRAWARLTPLLALRSPTRPPNRTCARLHASGSPRAHAVGLRG
jgi:hypothetical protein